MTLTHPSGISATVRPFGATLRSLFVPDREGRIANILVGFENEDDWLQNDPHFGCTIGRFANRIANGQFNLTGNHQQSILLHELQIYSERYLPVDSTLIPMGEVYENVMTLRFSKPI